jgi:hypothetical protein
MSQPVRPQDQAKAEGAGSQKAYVRPSIKKIGNVRDVTLLGGRAGGDGLSMQAM